MKKVNYFEVHKEIRKKIKWNTEMIRVVSIIVSIITVLHKKKVHIRKPILLVFKEQLPDYHFTLFKGYHNWELKLYGNNNISQIFYLGKLGEDQIIPELERFESLNPWLYSYQENNNRLIEFKKALPEKVVSWNSFCDVFESAKDDLNFPYISDEFFKFPRC